MYLDNTPQLMTDHEYMDPFERSPDITKSNI